MMCPVSYRRSRTYVSNPKTLGGGREEERVSAIPCSQLSSIKQCLTIWYDATSYIYTCSKADISQLNTTWNDRLVPFSNCLYQSKRYQGTGFPDLFSQTDGRAVSYITKI